MADRSTHPRRATARLRPSCRRRRYRASLIVTLCLAAPTAWAAEPTGTDVVTRTVDEDTVRGELLALSSETGAMIRTATGDQRRIALEDIVRLSTGTRLAPRGRRESVLTLRGGDSLTGEIVSAEADATIVDTVDLGRVAVPLESLCRWDTSRARQPAFAPSVAWLDRQATLEEDVVLLTNGDVLRGFIKLIDERGLTIEGGVGETEVPHRLVVTARFAAGAEAPVPELVSESAPSRPPHLIVTLKNSGRLTLRGIDWTGTRLQADLAIGRRIVIESERIVSVDVVGGRWEWLGGQQPISYEHTPMLSLPWEYAVNRNVLGGPITVAGTTYEHGLGVHSRTSLTYDLKGEYRTFVTSFGIDDDSGPYADVAVHILIDGRPRHETAVVRRGELFGPIRLDVTKAKRIELIVDFGANGDMQDRFDWVDAALVR